MKIRERITFALLTILVLAAGALCAAGCATAPPPTIPQVTSGRTALAATEIGINATATAAEKRKARPWVLTVRAYLDATEAAARAALPVPPTAKDLADLAALDAARAIQRAADEAFDAVWAAARLTFPATRPTE
jgi:hypothetical protein